MGVLIGNKHGERFINKLTTLLWGKLIGNKNGICHRTTLTGAWNLWAFFQEFLKGKLIQGLISTENKNYSITKVTAGVSSCSLNSGWIFPQIILHLLDLPWIIPKGRRSGKESLWLLFIFAMTTK